MKKKENKIKKFNKKRKMIYQNFKKFKKKKMNLN